MAEKKNPKDSNNNEVKPQSTFLGDPSIALSLFQYYEDELERMAADFQTRLALRETTLDEFVAMNDLTVIDG